MMRKHSGILGLLLLALCVGFSASSSEAAELVLVEDGVSQALIVVFENAPPFTRRAADELAEYIEKTSGARPEVIEGRPDPVPQSAIWVGHQPVMDELFPNLDFDFQRPEEILIAATENHLVIAGRDRWNPDRLIVPGRNFTIEGKQQEYGTVNAVYTFLRDRLGVRWLWPGEEDVLQKDTLAFAPFEYRYAPQVRDRDGLFRLSAPGDGRGMSHDWLRHHRLYLDSLDTEAGHAFTDWWDKYHEEHPDYFALQPDGTRSGFPGSRTVKICQANPAVWEQWLANVAERLKTDPDQKFFAASPNDSFHRGHCICDRCRAWDHPGGDRVMLTWQGLSQQYVSLSDRQVTFANTLARLLKERFPDKNLSVGMHAYGESYMRPPVEAVPDDNVIISVVANFFLRPAPEHRERLEGWAKVAPGLVWRPNTGSPVGWQQGQPDVALRKTMKDFRFVGENHCVGMRFDTVWENWPTQAPIYYIMAQMAWDPQADGEALLKDYYRRGFGPAAGAIEAYWNLMEEARDRKVEQRLDYGEVYDEAFFGRAYGLLDQADAALAEGADAYRGRIAFFRAGLDFHKLMTENRVLMARYRKSEGADADAAEKVRENWKEIERIATANLMNYSFYRPGNRYSRGLHPDYD